MTNYFGRIWVTLLGVALFSLTLLSPSTVRGQVSLVASLDDGEARIEAGLARRISVRFVDTPLRDIVQYVAERTGLPVQLSKKIADAGVEPNHPVTFSADNIAAEAALKLILREVNLSLLVEHGRVIVTTVEETQSPEHQTTHVYPVADLLEVVRIPAREGGGYELDYGQLIDTITTTLEPDSWSDVGGPGSITEFENSRSLVISTRRDIHQRIAALLVSLRKAKGLQGIRSTSLHSAAESLSTSAPLKLSAPLPTPSREPAARVRVSPVAPRPEPPALGGGGLF